MKKEKRNCPMLFVFEKDDSEIGLIGSCWALEAPIVVLDYENMSKHKKEKLDIFREQIINVYNDHSEVRVFADYDFELEKEAEEEQ